MNLVIVEDSELVCAQLQRLITALPGIHVIGTAATESAAVERIRMWDPDAVLLDLSLAAGNGLKVLAAIRAAGSRARVLVLTNHADEALRQTCESFGIAGFYDKSEEMYACLDHLNSLVPCFPEEGSTNGF
jgi:DNA-binding NarL/FixJ family response regulator